MPNLAVKIKFDISVTFYEKNTCLKITFLLKLYSINK